MISSETISSVAFSLLFDVRLVSGILAPKQLDCTWLCEHATRAPKVVESCSKAQKTRQVFYSEQEKNYLAGDCGFFVRYVVSGGHLGHIGPFHLTLDSNLSMVEFR